MPVKCSIRLRRSISERRRSAVGRVAQAAGRLAHPGRQRPGRDRARVDLDGLFGGAHGLGKLGVSLQVTGQHASRPVPWLAAQLRAPCAVSRCAGQPVGGLVVLDASFQDSVFFLVFLGELAGGGELGFGVVVLFEAMIELGELEAEVEAVGLERDGFGQRRQGLLQISEAGEDLGEPGQGSWRCGWVPRRSWPSRPWPRRAA